MRARRVAVAAALAAVLLAGAALRFVGLNWDSGHFLHPDERFITMVVAKIQLPSSPDQYFETARSPLNPYNNDFGSFVYGTFPLFFVKTLAELIQALARGVTLPPGNPVAELVGHLRQMAIYGEIQLLGRALSGVADLLTISIVFLIGRRLHSTAVGLLAAALSAFTVLQIQAAHFFTAESALTLLCTLAFYLALRAAHSNSLVDWTLLGVATGLAAASKINALMLGAVVLAAAWALWYRTTRLGGQTEGRRFLVEDLVTGMAVVAVLAFVTFRLAQPYAFSGPGLFDVAPNAKYVADLETWQRFATGEADYPPGLQWTGTTPYLWQLTNMTLWGMGPPLAIAAWLGFLFASLRLLRNTPRYYLWALPVIWVGLNFAYWGGQFAKPMRYLLPIYPQLALFAAFGVVSLWTWVRNGERGSWRFWHPGERVRRLAVSAITLAVVGWTAFYGVAFASIYARPSTRIAASEWIYANVPRGSAVGFEHWDDPLPLRLPGRDSAIYRGVEYPLYGEDTPEKRTQLATKLDQTDYIFVSSNRLYGSIPKLPLRYPMTIRYYQALFSGEIGFDTVAQFTSRPSLFGIELNDDNAEEIFTVYEHPKVTILRKGATYSSANVQRILESVNLDQVVRTRPIHTSAGGLLLDDAERAATRTGGTWSAMFDRDSVVNALQLPVWYVTVQLLALLALPLTWFVFRRVADGGYALAKTIALLFVAYVPWLLASLRVLPYDRPAIVLGALLMAGLSCVVLRRHWAVFRSDIVALRRPIIATEILFGLAFLGFVALRAANPDLWHPAYGGEKPMDFAYLNAVIKTTWFPPYDPWFAGGHINYYYFGQVVVASLTKLTGIVPWVAYNLALPTLAGLVAINAASIVYNLLLQRGRSGRPSRHWWAFAGGAAGAALAVLAGNLHGVVQIFNWLGQFDRSPIQSLVPGLAGTISAIRGALIWVTSGGQGLPALNFNFWDPTRVITTEPVSPITEFPYFTFLYGDLHAHMIAMPVGLLVVALAVNLLRQPSWIPTLRGQPLRSVLSGVIHAALSPGGITLLLAALAIGVLRMANSWDYPTYLGLFAAGVVLSEALRLRNAPVQRAGALGNRWGGAAARSVVLVGLVVVVSQFLIGPYLANYALFYGGFERSMAQTSIQHYLIIMGGFLAILGAYLGFQLSALRGRVAEGALGVLGSISGLSTARSVAEMEAFAVRLAPMPHRIAAAFGGGTVFLAVLFLLAGLPVVGIAGLGIATLTMIALIRRPPPATLFVFLLSGTALALTAGVELITLKGDIGRMNTVFKFYLPAWLFLSLAGGALLALMARRAWSSPWLMGGPRLAIAIALALVLAATLIYPWMATPAKLRFRFDVQLPPSLDGMAYMSQARYDDNGRDLALPDDFAAINWMLDNIQGTPVIVEGLAPLYHWRSRVSIYTGLPTVLGWDWHQKQQRGDFAYMVDERARDVEAIFNFPDVDATRRLLRRYNVEYVYVGGQERAFYGAQNLQKFDRMAGLARVYERGAVTIYRVVD